MTRISSFEPGVQNVHPHRTQVACHWQVIQGDHETLLHLSTFGSPDRASEPKSSQSLQLDRDAAAQLLELLRRTFPGLA